MKPEPILAELNRLRDEIGKDPADISYLAVHHAFCFISYRLAEFQKYLSAAQARGEFDAYEAQDKAP